MKRLMLTLLLLSLLLSLWAWTPSNQPIRLGPLPLSYTGLPDDYLYPTYLSDPFAVRTELGFKFLSITEAYPDEFAEGSRSDVALGLRFNFFRFSPSFDPSLGIEAELGFMTPFYMNANGNDMIGFDGVYYFSLSLKPFDWITFRAARHHYCSHYGDEYDDNFDGNPYVDFDITLNMNMSTLVRDDFVFSVALYPMEIFNPESQTSVMIYGDYAPILLGEDILTDRHTTPAYYAYLWYQVGFEVTHQLLKHHNAGAIYLAAQVSAWQMTGYAPNLSGRLGYIFPETEMPGAGMRLSLIYYDGQSTINNFIYTRERYTGIVFTIDV